MRSAPGSLNMNARENFLQATTWFLKPLEWTRDGHLRCAALRTRGEELPRRGPWRFSGRDYLSVLPPGPWATTWPTRQVACDPSSYTGPVPETGHTTVSCPGAHVTQQKGHSEAAGAGASPWRHLGEAGQATSHWSQLLSFLLHSWTRQASASLLCEMPTCDGNKQPLPSRRAHFWEDAWASFEKGLPSLSSL